MPRRLILVCTDVKGTMTMAQRVHEAFYTSDLVSRKLPSARDNVTNLQTCIIIAHV